MSSSKVVQPGVYLIVIDGLPELYTWQDLKDFVRPEAEHEFWADLQAYSNGTTQKRGCIRTQRYKEACNLYKYLLKASVKGRKLNTVLWDISQSPPKQLAPNPSQAVPESKTRVASRAVNGSSSAPSNASTPTSSTTAPGYTAHVSPAALANSMAGLSLQQRQQYQALYLAQQQQQQQMQPQTSYLASLAPPSPSHRVDSPQAQAGALRQEQATAYVASSNGLPVYTCNGIAKTVSRGIFVSGINYKAREDDIKHIFGKIGNVSHCVLQKDSSTGKSKGVATMLYKTSKEAQRAVDKYDRKVWMDKEIKVRLDREPSTSTEPPRMDGPPLIVNGSRVS